MPHQAAATPTTAKPAATIMVALREIEVPAPTPASTGMQGQGATPGTADHSGEQWVHLVPAGTSTGRDGRGPYQLDAQAVTAAFAQHGADLPVDYEHQSLGAVAKSGPVPAAGWITAVEPRADGLWGRVSWTAQAAQLLHDRAYRYLSAVFDHLPDGRVIKLRGAGLVHSPNLPIQAAASQVVAGAGASIPSTPIPTIAATTAAQGQKTMTIEEMLERLRYMLNLPTLTDAAGVLAELDKLKAALGSASSTVAAQSEQIAQLQAAATAAQAAQTAAQASTTPNPAQWVPMGQYQAVTAQLAAMQTSQATSAVQTAVTAAMSAGKVAPAQKDWATAYASQDLKGFEAFVAASPVIVSAQAQAVPPQGVITAAQGAGALSDEERAMAKLMGISAADFAAEKARLSQHA